MKKDELTTFDGKDGRKSYVAADGKIYDVTESRLWKNGKHANRHFAGADLTEALKSAPHGPEVLERYKQIAELESEAAPEPESGVKETVRKLYKLIHPHPIMIHFPMGLINFSVIMQILFFITGRNSFEIAGYYALFTASVFLVPTMVSGSVSWWVNYNLASNKIFMTKITFSVILFVMCVSETLMRTIYTDIAYYGCAGSVVYNIMFFLNVPVLSIIGYNGGKLSWG